VSGVLTIDALAPDDWEAVRRIFVEGIESGHATFETDTPTWEKWDADHLLAPRLVARQDGTVIGWGVLSPASGRCVYAGVAEISLYVAAASRGKGVGTALLEVLVPASEAEGIWTLQAGIFPENVASLAVHRRCGFREVGRRERLGKHGGVWRDVILLERRSPNVGT